MRAVPAVLAFLLLAGPTLAQDTAKPAPETAAKAADGEAKPAAKEEVKPAPKAAPKEEAKPVADEAKAEEAPPSTTGDAAKPDAAPEGPPPATDAPEPAATDALPPAVEAPPGAATAVIEAPTTGTLSVTSDPAGTLFIDDKDTGLTTPVTDLPVEAGDHSIKVVADDGRSQSSTFNMEAGGSLSLNLTLPAPEPKAVPADTDGKGDADKADGTKTDGDKAEGDAAAADAPPPPADWSWMTVTGWSGLGLGTIGLLSGAVVLTTPTDPQQGPLGFGLFGAGVGMVLGGAVLLYLDNELSEPAPADDAQQAAAR